MRHGALFAQLPGQICAAFRAFIHRFQLNLTKQPIRNTQGRPGGSLGLRSLRATREEGGMGRWYPQAGRQEAGRLKMDLEGPGQNKWMGQAASRRRTPSLHAPASDSAPYGNGQRRSGRLLQHSAWPVTAAEPQHAAWPVTAAEPHAAPAAATRAGARGGGAAPIAASCAARCAGSRPAADARCCSASQAAKEAQRCCCCLGPEAPAPVASAPGSGSSWQCPCSAL